MDKGPNFSTPAPRSSAGRSTQRTVPVGQNVLETSVQKKVYGSSTSVIPSVDRNVYLEPAANIDQALLEEVIGGNAEDTTKSTTLGAADPLPVVTVEMPKTNPKGKKQWGPVVATRASARISKDGRTTVEKAQNRKMVLNLEVPAPKRNTKGIKNSFAVLDDAILMQQASAAGIVLGSSPVNVSSNINVIKNVELDRLAQFHADHPDMFLPSDVDITAEDVSRDVESIRASPAVSPETHPSEDQDPSSPWIEVSRRKGSSKRKLHFKHGSRIHLE